MKRFLIYTISLTFIIGIMAFELLSPTGKAGYSGAPGEGNCTSCHDGTVNSGSASVAITSNPSLSGGYTPGSDYTISVTISNSPSPNDKLFGVDAVALLGSGANGGIITITNSTLTKLKTNTVGLNTRNHVVHTGSGNVGPNSQTFSFKWTAPAAGNGTVTIYAALMGANDDGGTSGDQVYTTSFAATEKTTSVLNPPQLIYPANNAIDRLLTEQFSWNNATNALTYYIQISKDAAFSNILFQGNVGADTFKLVNNLVAETDYYWHVASVNASGTSAYSTAWKLTTSYKPIVLQTPTNQKTNVPINTKLTWLANSAGTQYQVQISKDANFTTTVVDTKVDNVLEYQNAGLENYKNYYWRVRLCVGSRVGLWSVVWSFKTTIKTPDLVYPANNAVDRLLTEQFKWKRVINAQSYYIQIAKDAAFANILFDGTAGADTFKLINNMLPETDYYWHVSAVTSEGAGEYSSTWKMKTSYKPVVLQSPANLKTNVIETTKLTWLANSSGTQYQIQISKVADFKSTIVDTKVDNMLEYQTDKLEYYQTYYWRVRLVVGTSLGLWSDVWSFKTAINEPNLIYPANNAIDQPLSVQFKWSKVSGAQSYYLQIAKDGAFTTMLFDGNVGADTFKLINNLLPESEYFWRVSTVSPEGTSSYSGTWKLETVYKAIALEAPTNQKVNLPITTKLSWTAYPSANQYQIQISKDADFKTPVVDEKVSSAIEYQTDKLVYYTTYYWRVRVVIGGSFGLWSDAWSFKTGIKSAELIFPTDKSTDQPIALKLKWSEVVGAKYYHLQVSKTEVFTDLVYNADSLTTAEQDIAGLLPGIMYYWRVNGWNLESYNSVQWSSVWSFTTGSTDVNDMNLISSIKLYPNPTGSKALISINSSESTEAKILVSSSDGKIVKSDIIQLISGETSYEINTDLLASGTYYITIITPTNFISRELVITK